jgi:hypothetical protein
VSHVERLSAAAGCEGLREFSGLRNIADRRETVKTW